MEFLNILASSNLVDMHAVGSFVDMHAAGLTDLWGKVLKNWITPLYIAAVAVFAIIFLKDRAWMKLIGFVGIAAVVGVLVFAGSEIFGQKNKGLTGVAKKAATEINTVNGPSLASGGDNSFLGSSSAFNK